ncbi:branched-chain amino acid ABC transporter permease [Mesorhizobium hungaricum]|jgi:branched-chain amino acid transport system permease protein|uniref:Branched-chain amino acid ABC transporter permease n=1 Tax=Mesorhizobium hungaricum TaxID=1566387 RepID=A0A1C2E3A1_9HYPH|nr:MULTISPECIES: branched-chain amino acid ABC transporter permease [Mesorhizobium]MBN9235806.1 branched-chain amino acid ABC transporter permease [Mesorhizobium sp.]MDQ0333100.1 branched-chain amino acid transport system permease protein [Mesorhizobium sp. YL-MeA3-2017]OCX21468.1 branched-chain amino acid ABC transporter permease [Mesorhizobium hungaricum]
MAYFIQTLIDALSLGSLYALAALGIGLLFGILRLINFAHGDYITIGAYSLIVPSTAATATVFIGGWNAMALIVAVCVIVVAAALLSDRFVFRFLRRAHPATLMVASFALGYTIQNIVLMIYGSRPKSVGLWPELSQVLSIGGVRLPVLQVVVISTTIVLLLLLTAFLYRTRFGIEMRAASDDFEMARYLGVRANFVIGLAFAISGLLASAISLLLLTQTGVLSPTMGLGVVLYAFIATVIGGMGSLTGSVIGGLAVGAASSFLQAYLPLEARPFRDAFLFGLVVLLLVIRPSGLLKVKAIEERV